jgi:hypothetical protein
LLYFKKKAKQQTEKTCVRAFLWLEKKEKQGYKRVASIFFEKRGQKKV